MAYFRSPNIWWETTNKNVSSNQTDTVFARIGSASTRGLVFQVRTNNQILACKLLLDTFTTSKEQNLQEIAFTEKLGRLAPAYFPTVYEVRECSDVLIPPDISSNLIVDSQIYHAYQKLAQENKLLAKRLLSQYRQSYDTSIFNVTPHSQISGYLMFSDLGDLDLKQWVRTDHADSAWYWVIDQVFDILVFLSQHQLVHGDLHLGNIMFFNNKIKFIDLGEMHHMGAYETTFDADKFISNFDYLSVSDNVINYLNNKSNVHTNYFN